MIESKLLCTSKAILNSGATGNFTQINNPYKSIRITDEGTIEILPGGVFMGASLTAEIDITGLGGKLSSHIFH